MAHRLNFARIYPKRLAQIILTIPRDERAGDGNCGRTVVHARDMLPQIEKHIPRGLNEISRRSSIIRPKNAAIFCDKRILDRLGARVDSEKRLSFICAHIRPRRTMRRVAPGKCLELFFAAEKRVKTRQGRSLPPIDSVYLLDHLRKGGRLSMPLSQRSSLRNKQMTLARNHHVIVVKTEPIDKAFPQRREKMKRSAQESDVANNGPSACQAADALGDNRIERGAGDIFLRDPLIDERAYVCLGKHRTTRSDGQDVLAAMGTVVELFGVHIEHAGDGIDEAARAACARAVHPQLLATRQKQDLRILSPDFDGGIRLRNQRLDRRSDRNDLLSERQAQQLGKLHSSRACNTEGHRLAGEVNARVLQCVGKRLEHVR